MKVIIIGAGLGGLSAAYCFAKRGHDVELVERSRQLSSTGGGISIRPSAGRVVQAWGLDRSLEAISDRSSSVAERDLKSGEARAIITDPPQYADWGTTRRAMIKFLYREASRAGAHIRFNTPVVQVSDDAKHAAVVLENGERISGDIILAADGIKSHTRPIILSDLGPRETLDPIADNTTFYSFDIPASDLTDGLGPNGLTESSAITSWMGSGRFVITRFSSKFNKIGLLFASQAETDQKGLWDENGDIEHVRKNFGGSCKEITKALQLAKSCDRWRLAEMPDLQRWSSKAGRIVLLGDSAHAMHPNAAQGFSTTLEDVAVLEFLFSRLTAGPETLVSRVVQIWQAIRKPRAERIKNYSQWNTQRFSRAGSEVENPASQKERDAQHENATPDMNAHFDTSAFWKWNVEYDAIAEAESYLAQQISSKL